MIKILLILVILISALPAGYLLAWLCRDELVSGRRWFKLLAWLSVLLGVIFAFINFAVGLSLIFISIVSLVSIIKSYDESFVEG